MRRAKHTERSIRNNQHPFRFKREGCWEGKAGTPIHHIGLIGSRGVAAASGRLRTCGARRFAKMSGASRASAALS
jgi:hypothetical protein